MYPTITPVDASRGAPMGRREWHMESATGVLDLFRVPLEEGYDPGGAYWGLPDNLWCATDGGDVRLFVRAESSAAAAREVWRRAPRGVHTLRPLPVLDMVTGYVRALLWCNVPDGGEWEGKTSGDLAPEALEAIQRDCAAFWARAADLLAEDADYEQVGADLYLTANGHGTGFWDRPEVYGEDLAQVLTDLARAYGEAGAYVGDDGKIYR